MPFLDIFYRSEAVEESRLPAIRDAIRASVSESLTRHDPEHPVTPEMVDARLTPTGPLDVLNVDMLVSIRARSEPARHAARNQILAAVESGTDPIGVPPDTMIELILTDRSSVYQYPTERLGTGR